MSGITAVTSRTMLVGCPRSGTTLLQSMLAAHPAIASFPETHFFGGTGKPWLSRLGLATPGGHERRRLLRFLDQVGRPDLAALVPSGARRLRSYTDAFVRILDTLALEEGRVAWVEKTPRHLHFIPLITRTVPGVRFVHIIRDGRAVVASLYDVSRRHPEAWGGPRDIDDCLARWNRDVAISERYVGRPRHHLVRYEELIGDPEGTLRALATFLGVGFDAAMLDERARARRRITLADETWKEEIADELANVNERRFSSIFSRDQQEYIQRRLHAGGSR